MSIVVTPSRTGADYHKEAVRAQTLTVFCDCGTEALLVNWIAAPYTGGYLRVTCPTCQDSEELLDDYA